MIKEGFKLIFWNLPQKLSKSSHSDSNGEDEINSETALPRFKDVPETEKPNLFVGKLRACCVVLDFSDPSKNLEEKEIKGQTLRELVDYVASVAVVFDDVAMQALMEMVALNLFRTLPSAKDENDEEPWMEPAWPHIQLVYELLLGFLISPKTDTKLAERYIDISFIFKLLDLIDSEDLREREYLKTVMSLVYKMFMVHRLYIRQAINNILFISKKVKHNGIAELLDILGCIIKGFTLPFKNEYRLVLRRALIPLHKPKCVSIYHKQLSYCILQLLEKDFELADIVITCLLKYWPVTDSSKEVMFLGELKEVLKATQAAEFELCVDPLFQQISGCINSSNFEVAEKAVCLWNDNHIRNLISLNHEKIMPLVSTSLERNTHGHWKEAVHSLTLEARKLFNYIADIDAVSLERNSHGILDQADQSLTQDARKVFSDIAGIAAVSVGQSVEFTLEELADATDDFNLPFKIGQGGFGDVYYAELRGKQAAIKKMNMEASKEFLAELKVLTHVHHVNLVHLIGYCVKGSLFLVYEYVENGNLQQHLHGIDPLPWTKRVQIALDSARGLEYIHEHTVPTYVHRDIKSANILIDQSFRAKVADFGLTKLVVDGGSLTRAMGTFGYMAPEIFNGEVSAKVDVYAFGVVLYELISAKHAIVKSKESGGESRALVSVFEQVFKETNKEKALRKIIDPRLGDDYPFDSVYKMAELGRACTRENAQLRPNIRHIVFALSAGNWDVENF